MGSPSWLLKLEATFKLSGMHLGASYLSAHLGFLDRCSGAKLKSPVLLFLDFTHRSSPLRSFFSFVPN